MKNILILLIILFLNSNNIFAHQPKLIFSDSNFDNPIIIKDPEISKAYYSKLNGSPHYYKIESNNLFNFYTGILSPKISENHTWFSLEVINESKEIIFQADGSDFNWYPWYEPYAQDWYFKGPEIGIDIGKEFKTSMSLNKGIYYIKVFNDNNFGSYSLAVGELEYFGSNLFEQIITWTPILLYISPLMDIIHWNKFDIKAYIAHIFLFLLIFLLYFIFKKIFEFKKNILK